MKKLFKSKEEKEMERRSAVRGAMNALKKRIARLEADQKVYVNAAQEAIKAGLPEQVALAKSALKMTVGEKKRTQQMLLNAQIISQMKDMTMMTNDFLKAMEVISKDIGKTANTDMAKITNGLKVAMGRVTDQTEQLSDLLEDSQSEISSFGENAVEVADDEVDSLIYGAGKNSVSDDDIDKALAELGKYADND